MFKRLHISRKLGIGCIFMRRVVNWEAIRGGDVGKKTGPKRMKGRSDLVIPITWEPVCALSLTEPHPSCITWLGHITTSTGWKPLPDFCFAIQKVFDIRLFQDSVPIASSNLFLGVTAKITSQDLCLCGGFQKSPPTRCEVDVKTPPSGELVWDQRAAALLG